MCRIPNNKLTLGADFRSLKYLIKIRIRVIYQFHEINPLLDPQLGTDQKPESICSRTKIAVVLNSKYFLCLLCFSAMDGFKVRACWAETFPYCSPQTRNDLVINYFCLGWSVLHKSFIFLLSSGYQVKWCLILCCLEQIGCS